MWRNATRWGGWVGRGSRAREEEALCCIRGSKPRQCGRPGNNLCTLLALLYAGPVIAQPLAAASRQAYNQPALQLPRCRRSWCAAPPEPCS